MKKILLPLLFAFFAGDTQGQSILRFQHLNVEDGLSQSSVYSIFQDSHGYMWFATGDGLNRYDGKEFTAYKGRLNDTTSSHPRDRTINSSIFEDNENKLWVTSDAGTSYMDYRYRRSRTVTDIAGESIYASLLAIDNDSLWAIQPQTGIYAINTHNLQYKCHKLADKWQCNRQKAYAVYGCVQRGRQMWIADEAGLLLFNRATLADRRLMIQSGIRSVMFLENGKLLLTASGGVYLYDTGKNTSEFIPLAFETGKPLYWESSAEDVRTHTVYLGASNSNLIGKLNTDTRKLECLNFQNSIVNCLYIDGSQNLWIGTEGNGIYKFDIKPSKFFCFTPAAPMGTTNSNGLMVKSIYRNDSGKILYGTFNRGLLFYDPVTQANRQVALPHTTDGQLISTILKDASGNFLVTLGDRVLWLDPKTLRVYKDIKLPETGMSSGQGTIIYCLTEWKKDHYLAGTNVGLFAINNEKGEALITMPFSNNEAVRQWTYGFYGTKNATVYIGKRAGFVKIRMLTDSTLQVIDEGFKQVPVRHFYKSTRTPILWIAAENGLIAYNEATKKYKGFDESSGLANSFVYAILAASDSSLWISTNHGISNVKVHYGDCSNVTASFVNYTSKDGLQSNEFNTGAYYQSPDGTLVYGGIAGINWFNPPEIRANPYKARPSVSAVYVNDTVYAGDSAIFIKTLTLPYNRNTISFTLRALEFTKTEQNQFAYKLEGVDKDWVFTFGDKARYSNLPPGNYNFLLKVSNNDGIWNDEPLKIEVVIRPPFWQTWWFISAVALLIAVIVYLVVRYYVRQKIKTRMHEFEKQQALNMERLRISKDVHDDLGSGLSKISLMADIAQTHINGDKVLGNDIKHISAVSRELVENMRDLIWVLNPENTTLDQLVSRLREYCTDYMENIPIELVLDFPNEVPVIRISREAQRNIFLTIKEAINNCIKHADASQIMVTLKFDVESVIFNVSDNGQGFDISQLKGSGNGLRNMKHRIELIGGVFNFNSRSGSTSINIIVSFDQLTVEKLPL